VGTTTEGAGEGQGGLSFDLTAMAQTITKSMLGSRAGLPRERNGRPKAPSNPRAEQIRKEMAAGRSAEVLRLVTVSYTDLEDDVPFHLVAAPYRRMLSYLELHWNAMQRERGRAVRPLPVAIQTETKAQHRVDLLENTLLMRPACPETLTEAIRATDQHIATLTEFSRSCHAALAALTLTPAASAERGGLRVAR
jgi:hypothetical protein